MSVTRAEIIRADAHCSFLKTIGDFVGKISRLCFFYSCAVLLLSSCSQHSGSDGNDEAQVPIQPLSCIAVLPAGTSAGNDAAIEYEEARSLQEGAAYANDVLRLELAGNPRVRFLNSNQVATLVPEIAGGMTGTVAAIGKKMNCDGVLLTTVRRYQQRQGTEYAADAPAFVDFSMVLRHSGTGTVLWSTDFREEQQSFLSNVFTFSKAKTRGFKWVSAEQLMEQGMKQRLGECPYLHE
jgi:hypothetical protein